MKEIWKDLLEKYDFLKKYESPWRFFDMLFGGPYYNEEYREPSIAIFKYTEHLLKVYNIDPDEFEIHCPSTKDNYDEDEDEEFNEEEYNEIITITMNILEGNDRLDNYTHWSKEKQSRLQNDLIELIYYTDYNNNISDIATEIINGDEEIYKKYDPVVQKCICHWICQLYWMFEKYINKWDNKKEGEYLLKPVDEL
jgi:hypothetical protein